MSSEIRNLKSEIWFLSIRCIQSENSVRLIARALETGVYPKLVLPSGAASHLKCELFQMDGEVNGGDRCVRVYLEQHGGEVEDAANAGFDHDLGYLLPDRRRHREQAQSDALRSDHVGKFMNGSNRNLGCTRGGSTDLGGVVIESGDDLKASLGESPIGQQGPTEVTDTHKHNVRLLVDAEDRPDLFNQFRDAIAHARSTKLPEIAEVLSDLSV